MDVNKLDPFADLIIWFLVCFFVFNLIICKWKPSKLKLKYIDYAWLFFGLLSLVSLSGEIRRERADLAEEMALIRTKTMHEIFSGFYVNRPSIFFCQKFIKGPSSPDDFDERVKLYSETCEWSRDFAKVFLNLTLPDYKQVRWKQFKPPYKKGGILNDELDGMKEQLSFYTSAVAELELIREAKHRTLLEEIFYYIWAYLFLMAIALRMAKTTGEIIQEKKQLKGSVNNSE